MKVKRATYFFLLIFDERFVFQDEVGDVLFSIHPRVKHFVYGFRRVVEESSRSLAYPCILHSIPGKMDEKRDFLISKFSLK